ncbi:MAG TPA: DUF222 domain-containing protein [Methylomirabilota bacterium]|nr:DUF222 domain-containing protein [Methylomirabilota bacterium]
MHPDLEAAQRLGDEIAELSAHIEVATARQLDLIRQFDGLCGWGHAGAKSCAEWLSWRIGLDLRAAYERVRVARALPGLPLISAAFARAEISYSKVRALTRVATSQTEDRLLTFAKNGTAAHVEKLTRAWRRVDRNAENREADKQRRSRTLTVYQDVDGMFVIRGRLTPEVGAVIRQALTAATDRLYAEGRGNAEGEYVPTTTQHQADALGIIAEAALHHDLDPGASGARYQVVVHVDAPVLADPDQLGQSALEETHCSAEQSRRIACDASRVIMTHDAEGRVLEVGARTRTIPPALRRALQHRDGGCRFPSCGSRFTQGHHIKHWANGGPTTLSNLASLCRRHHRLVHEGGFQVERLPGGELRFRDTFARVIPEAPRLPDVPPDAAESLCAQNINAEVHIDAHTLTPNWDGTRLDLHHAIWAMHPLAIRRN